MLLDFQEVEPLLESCQKEVTPFFKTCFFDFNAHNGFCHAAYQDGRPVSFYCSQLFDTGGLSYLEYHRRQLERIYGPDCPIDRSWACPPMEQIVGPVIYSGDALNVPGSRSLKESMLRLRALAKMNLYASLLSWPGAQASVGLARASHVSKGLGNAYGAFHTYPYATRWIKPPSDRLQDDVFLFSWQADILYQAQIDALDLEQEASGQPKAMSERIELAGYNDTSAPQLLNGSRVN
ncbi:hypothetical protein [Roseibium sp. TrichSKD4]|uniref:hypothetical protein n=1 Tax=Roseibium sp. TrichSKD4 TaxID=744980 RepID=UPI001AD91031|nr:hypothetical protein [Roseibium sp. TrichSKD4]